MASTSRYYDRDVKRIIYQLNFQLEAINEYFDSSYVSHGYLGDFLLPGMLVKKYDILDQNCERNVEIDDDGCIPEWGKHMLYLKLFSTGDEYVVNYYGKIFLIKVGCLITAERDGAVVTRIVYDEYSRGAMYFDDTFTILKCVTYEKYIKSANIIKRAFRLYKQRKLEEAAATKIQRAVMHYLYRPTGQMVKKLENRFADMIALPYASSPDMVTGYA